MEDHDRTRCQPEYEHQIYDDLEWLGFAPAAASINSLRAGPSPYRQSDSGADYQAALESSRRARPGLRMQLLPLRHRTRAGRRPRRRTGAPLSGDLPRPRPSPRLRYRRADPDARRGLHVRGPGPRPAAPGAEPPMRRPARARPAGETGPTSSPWLSTTSGTGSRMSCVAPTCSNSTGRQLALARLLGREHGPLFLHHPIIHGERGAKLSKRDASLSLAAMRARGMSAEEVIALAERMTGN